MTVDPRIRKAKPQYLAVDKDKMLSALENHARTKRTKAGFWNLQFMVLWICVPLALVLVAGSVGFTDSTYHVVRTRTVTAVVGHLPKRVQTEEMKRLAIYATELGPFIQAKHPMALPSIEIAKSGDTITPRTKEVIIAGVPFILQDVIQKQNYALPDTHVPVSSEFVAAKCYC
ncbi:hypothetical protein [Alicyclobacillus sp. SP_1]|uniref:hypothetical protein n=1 Tax=Alicyclobacillus sp. SP_1 TaxID=2942475 RepID=UPI002158984D|nr:hypothetical protein [Alicyclobacillus sp. SP_1]